MKDVNIAVVGSPRQIASERLEQTFNCLALADLSDEDRASIRGVAGFGGAINADLIGSFPNLEIVANFGVGYDGVDTAAAASNNVIVTNTPDVLTEEVADTTLGLLLMTVREFGRAEQHLRDGKWTAGAYPLTKATLRDRSVGIVGYGRIGEAVARRLDAMRVPVSYHSRSQRDGAPYRYYGDLMEMARDVDTLISILPGGAATHHLINAEVLSALGSNGVFINVGRGTAVDEAALIAALQSRTIYAAGLDVFENEPQVPAELMACDNAVLFPHVGSASDYTRDAMGALVIDNLVNWFDNGSPLTPVAETPWPREG